MDNVLTEEENNWIQARSKTINQMANSEFAGHIQIEDRVVYESIANKINGRGFNMCWSCSASYLQMGRLLKQRL